MTRRLLPCVALLAACSGPDNPTEDLAVGADLAAPLPDQAVPPADMGPPSLGRLTIGDVAGTFYLPSPSPPLAHTHMLLTLASFPATSTSTPAPGTTSYADPDFSSTPGKLHGCSVTRVDPPDGGTSTRVPTNTAGKATFDGYDAIHLLALDAQSRTGTPPGTIVCEPSRFYSCYYGGYWDGDGGVQTGITGDSTSIVLYPPVPVASLPPGASCDSSNVGAGQCEQHPIPESTMVPDGGTPSGIRMVIEGGTVFGAVGPQTVGTPDGISIASITGGGATAAASKQLDDIVLDPGQDLVITWACPDAGGCPNTFLDVISAAVVTSTRARDDFAFTANNAQAACLEQTGSASRSLTLKKQAVATLLGQQAGGSAMLVIMRLKVGLDATNGHAVYLTAGHGRYGFLRLP